MATSTTKSCGSVRDWSHPVGLTCCCATLRPATIELAKHRDQLFASAAKCLSAAVEAGSATNALDVDALARKYDVSATLLSAWLDYLGIGAAGPVPLGAPLVRKAESASGYDFIQGWVGDDALSVMANASDEHVRIPGNMRPHSIAVHPVPTLSVAVGWRSPLQQRHSRLTASCNTRILSAEMASPGRLNCGAAIRASVWRRASAKALHPFPLVRWTQLRYKPATWFHWRLTRGMATMLAISPPSI